MAEEKEAEPEHAPVPEEGGGWYSWGNSLLQDAKSKVGPGKAM